MKPHHESESTLSDKVLGDKRAVDSRADTGHRQPDAPDTPDHSSAISLPFPPLQYIAYLRTFFL